MITKFKIFESYDEGEPKLGDFIIANIDDPVDFIKYNLGRIWKVTSTDLFLVKYENIPEEIKKYFSYSDYVKSLMDGNSILVSKNQILHWAENERDLEHITQSKKYNL